MSGLNTSQVKLASFSDSEVLARYKDSFGRVEVHLTDSRYKDLLFIGNGPGSGVQSRLDLLEPNVPYLEYIKTMCLMSALHKNPKDILFLGMGGGTLPKYWVENFPNAYKTIVDIRPLMFEISQDHFEFSPDSKTTMVPEDARAFLVQAGGVNKKYDIIYVDIYIEGPSDLQNNRYFWKEAKSCLDPSGIVCANIWTSGENEIKYHNIKRFYRDIFNTTFIVSNPQSYQVSLCGTDLPFDDILGVKSGIRSIEQTAPTGINFIEMLQNHVKQV